MRHDFIHIIIVAAALLCSVAFNSCRAKKNIQKNSGTIERYERIERVVDTTRTVGIEEVRTDRSGSEVEMSFTRVAEFDSTGTIRSVSETWRDRRYTDLASEERIRRNLSLMGKINEILERDTSSTIVSEVVKVDTDSRPVQGIEWLWVIVGSAVVLVICGVIIYRRT